MRRRGGEVFPPIGAIFRGIKMIGNLCLVVTLASGEALRRGTKLLQVSVGNRSFTISHWEVRTMVEQKLEQISV